MTQDEAGGRVVKDVEPAPAAGVFDPHHPPDPALISDCVHCGFCLPTCPTYALWGEEMDSPRGRIWLMKVGLEDDAGMNGTYAQHFDACLGCMACVTACPSGVQYNKLIEATRAQVERNHRRTLPDRLFRALIFWLFPHPARLRIAAVLAWAYQRLGIRRTLHDAGLVRRLPARLRALEALMPDVSLAAARQRLPERIPAQTTARRRVGLLTGCVQSVFFAEVNAATARVLAAEGCEVVVPPEQDCCGALFVHAGREQGAIVRAKRMIATMERAGVDTVVVNAAGCGSSMKEYDHLLRDEPTWVERARAFADKVRDVTELLDELEPRAPRHPIPVPGGAARTADRPPGRIRIAYHDACHLAHAQGVRSQPRRQLRAVPDLVLLDIPEAELCCGSAGIYNLVEPEPAEDLGRRKAGNIRSVRPDAVATGNPGCLLQLRRYLDGELRLVHPIQLIDASIRGTDPW